MKRGEPYRTYAAHRIWLKLMAKMPIHAGEYDVAIAYWGDRTMFYMVDKVRAKRKITWLHFDYDEPPREDLIYGKYFAECDKIITVSKSIEAALAKRFPALCGKLKTIENIINVREIREKAKEPCDYRDGFSGKAVLSVGRLCEQKGFDLAIPAVARLYREGENIHYYIIGEGDAEYEAKLRTLATEAGGCVTFLPRTENPYKFMARCDVYLQPSRHEGKPITVEEAKIFGKPLCVTEYRSAREQIIGLKNAVVCEISEEGIYKGMREILRENIAPDLL
jgi:glycosyltransferase involved in cell wall biosynthesis